MADPADWQLIKCKVPKEDREYVDRRAVPLNNNRSEAMRRIIHDSRRLRHDLRAKISALDMMERCIETNAATITDLQTWIREIREELNTMVREAAEAG